MSWVYDTVCCTMYSCTMYEQRSVAYTNKNILFVSHVVYQSRTIRIIHEYTERYGGYNRLLHRFASSTFNTCPHHPLPCVTDPPVEIHLEDGVIPERCTPQPQCRYTGRSRYNPTSTEMRPSGSSKGSPTVS